MTLNGTPKALTFKKMVEFISDINTEAKKDEAYGLIDFSFQHEKLTWADHEMLYALMARIEVK